MVSRSVISVVLVLSLSAELTACQSEAERERAASAPAKTAAMPDGSIHLTPEKVRASGIQTALVEERELAPTINAIGRVAARAGGEAQVFSPFPGRLIADPARLPRVGTVVTKGDVIAEVEQIFTAAESAQIKAAAAQFAASSVQYQTAIEQAHQEADLRQIDFDRTKQLYESGVIALSQHQEAEFNLKQAQAKLAGAKLAKAEYESARKQQINAPRRIEILAPLAGTVVAADMTAGQQIDAAKSLITIADLSSVWVEAPIHESDLSAVHSAKRADITTPASPGRVYAGSVVTIDNVVDPANRTVPVTFAVANSDGRLKIGMTAEARIATGASSVVLLIPSSAVLYEEGQAFVYVETEPGVYYRRAITTGGRKDQNVVVTSGLNAGEKVVSVGGAALRSETFKGQIPTGEGG